MKLNPAHHIIVTVVLFLVTGFTAAAQKESPVTGSWKLTSGNDIWLLMAVDQYCMITHYDLSGKKFYQTFGGVPLFVKDSLTIHYQFCSADPAKTGTSEAFSWKRRGDKVLSSLSGKEGMWEKVGAADNDRSGIWRITGRKTDGVLKEMPLASRRTLKFLTNDRFQWAAINIETGEFSGTGGGTYTFKDGVYTETIEFFSRDDSRVGARLEFKDHIDGSKWIHTGASSKGAPIYEVWEQMGKESRE